jgi:hypothetical protein
VGGGTVGNLFALGVNHAELDKLFITHFHLDYVACWRRSAASRPASTWSASIPPRIGKITGVALPQTMCSE